MGTPAAKATAAAPRKRVARRQSQATVDARPCFRLQELKYPGLRFGWHEIAAKWIYVFHWMGDLKLLDEIYAYHSSSWWRMHEGCRGKRVLPKAGNGTPMRGGVYPVGDALATGVFYFYLSPMPLGPEAIRQIIDWTKKDEQGVAGRDIEKQFQVALTLARAFRVAGSANQIRWDDLNRPGFEKLQPARTPTTVRAAVNFDQNGKRITKVTAQTAMPWIHTVLLQDPEAWLEDMHVYAVAPAIQAWQDYRNDPLRHKMRFFVNGVATQIRKGGDSKRLEGELFDGAQRGLTALARIGWRKHRDSFLPSSKPRPVSHSFQDNYPAAMDQKYNPYQDNMWDNVAEQVLGIDSYWELAILGNASRFIAQTRDYIHSPRHRSLCAEHFHAMLAAHGGRGAKPSYDEVSGQQQAGRNAQRGMVHWSIVLSRLNETPRGRELISEITRAAGASGVDEAHYYTLVRGLNARGLSDKGSFNIAFGFYLVRKCSKSLISLIEAVMVGLLDESRMEKKGISRLTRFLDRLFSRALTAGELDQASEAAKARIANLEALARDRAALMKQIKAATDETFFDLQQKLSELEANQDKLRRAKWYGQLERTTIAEKHKLYGDRPYQWLKDVPTALYSIDAVVRIVSTIERLRAGKATIFDELRTLSGIGEATTGILETVRKRRAWAKRLDKAAEQAKPAMPRTQFFGRLFGVTSSVLDYAISLRGLTQAQHLGEAQAYLVCSIGAGMAVAAGFHGLLTAGAVFTGPLGWLFLAAVAGIQIVGYWLVQRAKEQHWRDFARKSFLGKEPDKNWLRQDPDQARAAGKVWLTHLEDTLLRFLMLFSAESTREGLVTIHPAMLNEGDRFTVRLIGRRVARPKDDEVLGTATVAVGKGPPAITYAPPNCRGANPPSNSGEKGPGYKKIQLQFALTVGGWLTDFEQLRVDVQLETRITGGLSVPRAPLQLPLKTSAAQLTAPTGVVEADPLK